MAAESHATLIERLYRECLPNKSGNNAQYIKELALVDPELFGVSFCSLSGEISQFGDYHVPFSLQSTCKPLMYMVALETVGHDVVHSHVGMEPSGQAFNAHVLTEEGLPHNPMLNSGAIMISSLLAPHLLMAERYGLVHDLLSRLCGKIATIGMSMIFVIHYDISLKNIRLCFISFTLQCLRMKLRNTLKS